MVEAHASRACQCRFKSCVGHHPRLSINYYYIKITGAQLKLYISNKLLKVVANALNSASIPPLAGGGSVEIRGLDRFMGS